MICLSFHFNVVVFCRDDNDGFHMSGAALNFSEKQSVFFDTLYEDKSVSQLYEESTKEKLLVEVSNSYSSLSYMEPGPYQLVLQIPNIAKWSCWYEFSLSGGTTNVQFDL